MEKWWKNIFTKGVKQRLDPMGLGYQSAMPTPLSDEDAAKVCDRRYNPAIITSQAAFEGDGQLSGSYEGPGYYLVGADGIARRIWAPGDKTQRPGEDVNAWKFRIGELQPEVSEPVKISFFPPSTAHAKVTDIERLEEKIDAASALLILLNQKIDALG